MGAVDHTMADLEATVLELTHAKLLFTMTTAAEDSELSEVFNFFCHERHAAENFLLWKAIQAWKQKKSFEGGVAIVTTFTDPKIKSGEVALTGKEFRFVEESLIQLMLVSLIPPFQLQFSAVYQRYKQGKDPIVNTHSPAFSESSTQNVAHRVGSKIRKRRGFFARVFFCGAGR